jgi:hypothetical protein
VVLSSKPVPNEGTVEVGVAEICTKSLLAPKRVELNIENRQPDSRKRRRGGKVEARIVGPDYSHLHKKNPNKESWFKFDYYFLIN